MWFIFSAPSDEFTWTIRTLSAFEACTNYHKEDTYAKSARAHTLSYRVQAEFYPLFSLYKTAETRTDTPYCHFSSSTVQPGGPQTLLPKLCEK